MYIFTGGKTGGHIMPLISIIKSLKEDTLYIGELDSLEERLCKKNNIDFVGYPKNKSRLKGVFNGYNDIKTKLNSIKIKAVISSGGYVAAPMCIYAVKKKIPLFLLEENVVLGASNKLFYPFCKKLFLAYELEQKRKKQLITGIPLRKIEENVVKESFDILVIGGSLGSKILCDAALQLSKNYKVCLIAGNYYNDYKTTDNLNVIKWSNDIYTLMKRSKLIIARAGASTASEIFYLNRPFICIPSMKTKANHQYYNAKYFSDNKACVLCLENKIDKDLKAYVDNLINNENAKINMYNAQKKLIKKDSVSLILASIKENINWNLAN